ncbi:MAG: non-heme iron oxygenase ferredoxin subunit [Spirochaetales bacterium]|jgi:3-phenylpropionate/trans-cinnamate dioxygenase ferredoxin component|nr:non-heme iron oxygenase ferredoxin subunit [Spirochaetales bacterium]
MAASESELVNRLRVEIDGLAYALFRLEDGIYALDDVCSHEYSELSEGEIWDGDVYCVKHGSRFDIKTGEVKSFPAIKPVDPFPVKVENGEIFIDIEGEI